MANGWLRVAALLLVVGCRRESEPPVSIGFSGPPRMAPTQIQTSQAGSGFGSCASCGPMLPPPVCNDDLDGISEAVELDAGLDPCNADTDNDGCSDGAELLLGSCDRQGDVVIAPQCFGSVTEVQVFYTMPSDSLGWSVVSLKLPDLGPQIQLSAIPLEALPAGGTTVLGDTFVNVARGTALRFLIQADVGNLQFGTLTQGTIVVLGDNMPELARPIIILPKQECPIPI